MATLNKGDNDSHNNNNNNNNNNYDAPLLVIYCIQVWVEEIALYSECTSSILNCIVSKIHCKSSKFCALLSGP